MHTDYVLSPQKIIFFTFFACAALITSVFVFHMREQVTPIFIDPQEGVLFKEPRTLKPFELVTADTRKFTQQDLMQHWTMLFFGFTHCSSICPTTLANFNNLYREIAKQLSNLQIVFVSLDPERDTPTAVNRYAQSFNPAFIGLTGKIHEVRKLQSQFNIYVSRDKDSNRENYQLIHTPSVLLINPHGQWIGNLNVQSEPKKLAQALLTTINKLKT